MKKAFRLLLSTLTAGLFIFLLSCESKKDAGDHLEDAGESMSEAAKEAGEATEEAAKDAAKAVGEAAEEAGDAVKDATN
jgi:hypothetical protein